MNEKNKFYISDSFATRFFLIIILMPFFPFSLVYFGLAIDNFELGEWLTGFSMVLIGGLLGVVVFAIILGLVHMKTYIGIGTEYIRIYKPKKRYSLSFIKYDIYYRDIKWFFLNRIRTLPKSRGVSTRYRYLFLIKKTNEEYAFLARNDYYGKWDWSGLLGKKISKIELLGNQLKSKEIKQYDKEIHNTELDKIVQENEYSIRMGNNYKNIYIFNKKNGTIIYDYRGLFRNLLG